jgi:hypothetical protein
MRNWHRWTPTLENVNALPYALRKYIHDLENTADPAGMVRQKHPASG